MAEQRHLACAEGYYPFYFYPRKYAKDRKGRQMYASKLWLGHHDNVLTILIEGSNQIRLGEIDTI